MKLRTNARRLSFALALLFAFSLFLSLHPAAIAADLDPDPLAEGLFKQVWDKADGPLKAGKVSRSYLWGPGPYLAALEDYDEATNGARYVMYFDKARMELTDRNKKVVTNGLLVVEMMKGMWQDGDARFVPSPDGPAKINVVGDPGNWLTYAKLAPLASLNNDKRIDDRTGQTVDQELVQAGGTKTSSRAGQQKLAYYSSELGHNIPQVFWDFFSQNGLIFDGKSYTQGSPINWISDMGLPITEAYWVKQKVAGVEKDVMVQAFERRVLTYTPTNDPAFQVEMGNVGRHYTDWGYKKNFSAGADWPAPSAGGTPAPIPGGGGSVPASACLPAASASGNLVQACVDDTSPTRNSTVTVFARLIVDGKPASGASMVATWHYKSSTPNCTDTTDSDGVAACDRKISSATPGYTVRIDVVFNYNGRSYSSSTSFTPQ